MKENKSNGDESVLVEVGRSLGRSRSGQLFVAFAAAALFCGLAYVAWHAPALASIVLTVGLLGYGLQLAWRLLPIPCATRERWARERQIAKRCPACAMRWMFWAGIGVGVYTFWRFHVTKLIYYSDLILPAGFVILGSFSHFLC